MSDTDPILDYATSKPEPAFYHRPLHVASLLTALLAFPLVWMGGLVTSHGAGLSVPDWPNSYGYNMFALPFSMWLDQFAGGTFYEHTHRLLGTLVGLAAFTTTMLAWGPSRHYQWRRLWGGSTVLFAVSFVATLAFSRWARSNGRIDEDTYRQFTHVFSIFACMAVASLIAWRSRRPDPVRWRRWAVTGLLGLVILQGVMGGFRVTEISLLLAKVHGIFGQIVFALAGVIAVVTGRWWLAAPSANASQARWLRRLAAAGVVLLVVQLTLGALMRHDPRRNPQSGAGAGLAIPDWPLHYGKLLPPTDAASLAAANERRVWEYKPPLPPTTLHAVWLHASHRLGAYLTTIILSALTAVAWRRHRDESALTRPATLLAVLVTAQVTLGVLTVLQRKPADIATAHQATGALLLATACVFATRVFRRYPRVVRADEPMPTDPSPAARAGMASSGFTQSGVS